MILKLKGSKPQHCVNNKIEFQELTKMSTANCVIFGLITLVCSILNVNSSETSTKSPSLELPFIGNFNVPNLFESLAKTSFEPIFKSVTGQNQDVDGKEQPAKSFFDMIVPKSSSATTSTTTTTTPLEDLTKTIVNLPASLPKPKLLDAPTKVLNTVIKSSIEVGAETMTGGSENLLKSVTDTAGKVVGQVTGLMINAKPEREQAYYEYGIGHEPGEYRAPKYFSKECNFRIACEVGRLVNPYSAPLHGVVSQNKMIQDLQNRYTRAMTYGMLNKSCERYFCFLVQLLGGPGQFASGVAELVNRMANPDMYEK